MLHELILALNGYPGELFRYNGTAFRVNSYIETKMPLLHPSEWTLLSEILEIATHYKQLHEFVNAQQHIGLDLTSLESDGSISTGIEYPVSRSYTSSICHGIEKILDDYMTEISDLELKILNDPFITFTHVRSVCEPFRDIFRLLRSFMNRIKAEPSSCLLIDSLKSIYDRNIHHWETLMPIVICSNIPLYKHVTDWVVFGSLPSPNSEFFIQVCRDQLQFQDVSFRSKIKNSTKKEHQKQLEHFVEYPLVPSHFSTQLVELILFMGKSVLILGKSEKTRVDLMQKQKTFLEKMKALPTNTFRTDALAKTMEELAVAVGKDLHHLVVIDANLMNHLSIIKDFYLGGRGEFFHAFLVNVSEAFAKAMSIKMVSLGHPPCLDIRPCFQLAASRVQIQEEILQKIEVVVTRNSTKANTLDGFLSEIQLNLKQEWPLHILFSAESMRSYNELFQFLLHVRRIQLQLKFIWLETRKIFRVPVPEGPLILRLNMSYFVNNLQHYLQADVLESQYAVLVDIIEKSDTFDQIRVALAKFQSNITVQSFRTNQVLRDGIQQMLELCESYCRHMNFLIQEFQENGIPVCEGRTPIIEDFTKDFQRRVEFLYASFRRLAGDPQFGTYLGQLLLRLDYNSYFTRSSSFPMSAPERSLLDTSLQTCS